MTVLNAYKDRSWVQGMAIGVIPIAGVMIGIMAYDFIKKSKMGLGLLSTILLAVASVVIIHFLHIHPAILIVVLILSAFVPFKNRGIKKEGADN